MVNVEEQPLPKAYPHHAYVHGVCMSTHFLCADQKWMADGLVVAKPIVVGITVVSTWLVKLVDFVVADQLCACMGSRPEGIELYSEALDSIVERPISFVSLQHNTESLWFGLESSAAETSNKTFQHTYIADRP